MPAPEKALVETAYEVVDAYGEYMQYNPLVLDEIRDQSALPYAKDLILKALTIKMLVEHDTEVREAIVSNALLLASFQPNVGDASLWRNGVDAGKTFAFINASRAAGIEVTPDDMLQLMNGNESEGQRHASLRPVVRLEIQEIGKKMVEANKAYRKHNGQ